MGEQSVLDFISAYLRWIIQPRRYLRPTLPIDDLPKTIDRSSHSNPDFEEAPTETPSPTEGGAENRLKIGPIEADNSSLNNDPDTLPETHEVLNSPKTNLHPSFLRSFPWRSTIGLFLAIWGQVTLEPPERTPSAAVIFYFGSAIFILWAIFKNEWIAGPPSGQCSEPMPTQVRTSAIWIILALGLVVFLAFGGNRFTTINLLLWGASCIYIIRIFWIKVDGKAGRSILEKIIEFLKNGTIKLNITRWHILLLLLSLGVLFFRFFRLEGVPGEMFSDHAEKLLDVGDVLKGKYYVFFVRNTGREALQMYLTAGVALLLNTGLSFMSLKIGTVLAGVLTLPYIYKLGKEVGNEWVGLIGVILAGIAYWPNVISRIGLRFPLYPLFAAPLLFYLVRGIRSSNRNDMILAGIALGLGLHGYSPSRILPFVVLVLVGVFLLHPQTRKNRLGVISGVGILGVTALFVFLPLLRYAIDEPQMFGLRALSRLGTTERLLPGPALIVFFSNLWKALLMPFWDNGGIWVHSVVGRPALDVISAALFSSGIFILVVRYIRQRSWVDLWLLISVPLLMLPSILSLAFPEENPSLNRTGAAYIPIFIIAAIGLESYLSGFVRRMKGVPGKAIATLAATGLILISAFQNYNIVFEKFDRQFISGAWNTSEIGGAIKGYMDSIGDPETAFVVPYPHWVDTRLVGINAGMPGKDFALWPEDFPLTLRDNRSKLFVIKPEDQDTIRKLKEMYPDSFMTVRTNALEGKNFVLFFTSPLERSTEKSPESEP